MKAAGAGLYYQGPPKHRLSGGPRSRRSRKSLSARPADAGAGRRVPRRGRMEYARRGSPQEREPMSAPEKPLDDDLEREIAEALGDTSLLGLTGPGSRPAKPTASRSRQSLDERLEAVAPPAPPGQEEEGSSTGARTGVVTHVGRDDVFLEFG